MKPRSTTVDGLRLRDVTAWLLALLLAVTAAPTNARAQLVGETPDPEDYGDGCVVQIGIDQRPTDPYGERRADFALSIWVASQYDGSICSGYRIDRESFRFMLNGEDVSTQFTVAPDGAGAVASNLHLKLNGFYNSFRADVDAVRRADASVRLSGTTGDFYALVTAQPCRAGLYIDGKPTDGTTSASGQYNLRLWMYDPNVSVSTVCTDATYSLASFNATLGGVNRTDYFVTGDGGVGGAPGTGMASAAGYAVPLVRGATNTFSATVSGTDWTGATTTGVVTASTSVAPAPTVDPSATRIEADTAHNGPTLERALCLTMSVGPAAAYECGDLRLVHALPSTRTMGKARTPTLLYNSRHAFAQRTLTATVTVPGAAPESVSVSAYVTRAGTDPVASSSGPRNFGYFEPQAFENGSRRHVGVVVDLSQDTTGLYAYALAVRVRRNGQWSAPVLSRGELALVNRGCVACSALGAGWWLAGLEKLVPVGDGRMLWIEGDGSTRVYVPDPTNSATLRAPILAGLDSLKHTPTGWTRFAGGGLRVLFNPSGAHVATTNRLGQTTDFSYVAGRLQQILLPTAGAARPVYQFAYVAHSGGAYHLQSVTAPAAGAARTVAVATLDNGFVNRITDPDNTAISFAAGAVYPSVIVRRGDRGENSGAAEFVNNAVEFAYERGMTLESVWQPFSAADTVGAWSRFHDADTRGLAANGTTASATVSTDSVYSWVDGPRTDVSDQWTYWPNGYGAAIKIINALGDSTTVAYDSARFPVLAVSTRRPGGLVSRAHYDARGNAVRVWVENPLGRSPAQDAITTYEYDARWDAVTKVTSPTGIVTEVAYDPANGNPLWEQTGGQSRRLTFSYYPAGPFVGMSQLSMTPTGPGAEFRYSALGNVRFTKSPIGFVSLAFADAVGRDTLVVTPIDSARADSAGTMNYGARSVSRYDIAGRVFEAVSAAGAGTAAESVLVATQFDPNGRPKALKRRSAPDKLNIGDIESFWKYDFAGRLTNSQEASAHLERKYDPAGNVVWTSRGDSSRYDALGRRTRHWLPAVKPGEGLRYTRLADEPIGGAEADAELFRYDADGNLLEADNRYAQIRRTYFPNGAIKRDSSANRTERDYDLDGRVTVLRHDALTASASATLPDVVTYTYDATTGALRTVRDPNGNTFTYTVDNSGRLTTLASQTGTINVYGYDADSRVARFDGSNASRDARGKILSAMGFTVRYSPMGGLTNFNGPLIEETHEPDALGHDGASRMNPGVQDVRYGAFQYTYRHYSGALANTLRYRDRADITLQDAEPFYGTYYRSASTTYNSFGDRWFSESYHHRWVPNGSGWPCCAPPRNGSGNNVTRRVAEDVTRQTHTYDAKGLLRYVVKLSHADWGMYTFQADSTHASGVAYRYDALGRRISVESTSEWAYELTQYKGCCDATLKQAWDGSQLLAETRVTNAGQQSGLYRVVYTAGTGIDQPLAIYRTVPDGRTWTAFVKQSWRGLPDCGGAPSGESCDAWPEWPDRHYMTSRLRAADPDFVPWYGSLLAGEDAAGLQYMRNRYYDPKSGQFTQVDPIGIAGGLNTYGFALGDPVNYSDPFGLWPKWIERAIQSYDNWADGVERRDFERTLAQDRKLGLTPGTTRNMEDLATDLAVGFSGSIKKVGGDKARPYRGQGAPAEAFRHLKRYHGVDPHVASDRLHVLKDNGLLGPADDVIIGRTGDVYNAKTGEHLGSLTNPNLGGGNR